MRFRLLFTLWLLLLSIWHLDLSYTPNPTSRALLVASLVDDHCYAIDRLKDWSEDRARVGDHYFSDKAPLSSWLTVPAYAVAYHLLGYRSERYPHRSILVLGSLLSGVLPILVFSWLLSRQLALASIPRKTGTLFLIAAIPSSILGVYSSTFFGHVLGGLLLVLAWRAVFDRRQPFQGGLWIGLAGLAEFPILFFLPVLALAALSSPKRGRALGLFSLGCLIGLIFIGIHNLWTTGKWLEFAYKHVDSVSFQHMRSWYGFRLPDFRSVLALIASPSRGLLFYAPTALFTAVHMIGAAAHSDHPHPTVLKVAAVFGFLFLVGSYEMWEGGWAFGPRHLIPIIMVLIYEGAGMSQVLTGTRTSRWLVLVAVLGGIQVFLAKSTAGYMIPPEFDVPQISVLWTRFLKGSLNPLSIPTLLLGIPKGLSHLAWLFLFAGGFWILAHSRRVKPQ